VARGLPYTLRRYPPLTSRRTACESIDLNKETLMAEPRIPDRSAEPELQASLDHSPKATTAATSDDVAHGAPAEARDDEGNLVQPVKTKKPGRPPDAHQVEEVTAVPESSEQS
jgi:hypothetical protein